MISFFDKIFSVSPFGRYSEIFVSFSSKDKSEGSASGMNAPSLANNFTAEFEIWRVNRTAFGTENFNPIAAFDTDLGTFRIFKPTFRALHICPPIEV